MELTLPTALLCFTAAALWLHWLWTRRHFYRFAAQFPGLWGLLLIGVFLQIGSINNVLPFITRYLSGTKSRTICLWLAVTPAIFTVDPKVAEQILNAPELLEKGKVFYTPVREALRGGLVALTVEKWQRHRKIVAPTLRHKQLLSFMPIFNRKSREFLTNLEENRSAGAVQHLLNTLRLCTLTIAKETTMGNAKYEQPQTLNNALKHLVFFIRHTSLELILNCAHLRFLIKYNPVLYWSKRILYNFANDIISERSIDIINESSSMPNEDAIKGKPCIFIDQALKFYKSGHLNWTDIIGEANGLLVASFETTSSTIFSTLVLLATHATIQERVYEELRATFATKDADVNYKDFGQLTYLDMVINEALRLFPAAPLIARHATAPIRLEIGGRGFVVPQHMQVAISIYHLQRDPEIWGPHAHEFNPDNFLPHKVAERHPYAFLPFSKGARSCLGWTYAYFTMKVLLSHILRNYRVTTDFKYEDIKVNLSLFLEYRTEPLLEFHSRV